MNKTTMNRMLGLFVLGVAATPLAWAQSVSLGEVLQKGAAKLSAQEVRAVTEGAKVTDNTDAGSIRRWENESGGKFVASSTNAKAVTGRGAQGSGSWRIDDEGRYCVEIAWARVAEKWCRYVFRAGDKFYASSSDSKADTKAFEMEFKK